MAVRIKTNYPGVFYREAQRIGGKGTEKVFYVVFKKDGKLFEEKVGRQYVDDMTAARAATIRSQRIEGKRLSRKEIRNQEKALKEAEADRWTLDRLWGKYKSGRVYDSNLSIDDGRYRKHLHPSFGDKEPGDLILLDVDRLRLNLSKKLSPQSVKHVLNLLDRIVNFGASRNLCNPLPFKIKKPQVSNTKTEDLTPGQLTALLKAIDKDSNIHAANMMRMVLFTGMRRGELFKLKWKHIDFYRAFIHIIDPKGGPDQIIPLNDAARAVLEAHPKEDSDFVFPGKDGKLRVTINVAVNRIKKRAGLSRDFRPLHGLRHAYASMLASSGQVDMYVLQKLMTHKDPRMTQRYAHLRDESLRKASNLTGTLIDEAVNGQKQETTDEAQHETK